MSPFHKVLFAVGVILYVLSVYWAYVWWGLVGAAIAVFIVPFSIAFPFVHWYIEGFSLPIVGLGLVAVFMIFIAPFFRLS